MGILEKEVWTTISGNQNYYEEKGYEIPRRKSKWGDISIPQGTKILVKIEDLPESSGTKVTKVCDDCECIIEKKQPYVAILRCRLRSDGRDRCRSCGNKYNNDNRKIQIENSLSFTHPQVAKLLKNKERGYELTSGSGKKEIFICNKCSHESNPKSIYNVVNNGFSCQRCSDGISYPEKFLFKVLEQLNIKFKKQIIFEWSDNKRYDFYIPLFNCIIETHGIQHYEESFKHIKGKRTLKEEQYNDMIKEKLANENGIANYITIDCRKSEMDFLRESITNSNLRKLLNFNNINWIECHEFACSTLVKKICDLWNSGIKNTSELGKIIKTERSTVRNYLKQGNLIGWISYIPNQGSKKEIIQLSKKGDYIKLWKSTIEAEHKLGINNITRICKGNGKTAGGYKWMYKEDYDQYIKQTQTNS